MIGVAVKCLPCEAAFLGDSVNRNLVIFNFLNDIRLSLCDRLQNPDVYKSLKGVKYEV